MSQEGFFLMCWQNGQVSALRVCPKISGDQRRLIFNKNIGISSFTECTKALLTEISDVTLTVFESLDHQKDSHEQDKD